MSTLWTPGGEHTPRPEPPADEPGGPGAGPGSGGPAGPGPGPGAGGGPGAGPGPGGAPEIDEAQMRQALAQLASTPVASIVADHAVRLHELAVLHMGLSAERSESLAEASLAIDAMAALVEDLAERLGDAAGPLAEALSQLRLAYVQVRDQRQDTSPADEA